MHNMCVNWVPRYINTSIKDQESEPNIRFGAIRRNVFLKNDVDLRLIIFTYKMKLYYDFINKKKWQ